MKHNNSILITAADNGFIVNEVRRSGGTQVFQSYTELSGFLAAHFTHRVARDLSSDVIAATTASNADATGEAAFVTIPQVTLPNGCVIPSFQVGKYACSKSDDGKATVGAEGAPWVRVSYRSARKACEDAGLKLITETQCLAIAHNIANQDINWTGGKVGEGHIYQGLHKSTVETPQPGTYEPTDALERRWHQFSNGERIYDFAGNVYTWVFDDVQGDADGLVAKAFADNSPSITTAPNPSRTKGMGWRPDAGADWSGSALIRGGCWYSESGAGVFYLDGDWPDNGNGIVGFRCTK